MTMIKDNYDSFILKDTNIYRQQGTREFLPNKTKPI